MPSTPPMSIQSVRPRLIFTWVETSAPATMPMSPAITVRRKVGSESAARWPHRRAPCYKKNVLVSATSPGSGARPAQPDPGDQAGALRGERGRGLGGLARELVVDREPVPAAPRLGRVVELRLALLDALARRDERECERAAGR
jgi:hypothetical protein